MEKMFKFVLLISLGFLPDAVSSIRFLDLSIVGYLANSEKTGFVTGTFIDRAARKEGRCTHVTLFKCNPSADCSQSSSWQEACRLFAYPCQMTACGNSTPTQQECYCSTGHPTVIWFTVRPTMQYRLNAKLMEHNQELGQLDSNVFVANSDDPEHSRSKSLSGSNQLRFDLELVVASVLVASYLAKPICT
ncbi:uncharacterized protein LOC131945999 [Physella acuta]|uniref:uncharacterized protein LOC131945999 n=1 Tax=Physella acuta TaxID=109671 RepID=UPI0027DBE057|nr:uncharacterized protein LOC131945999 [Physella acuta]